jgi:hypothetical protein
LKCLRRLGAGAKVLRPDLSDGTVSTKSSENPKTGASHGHYVTN